MFIYEQTINKGCGRKIRKLSTLKTPILRHEKILNDDSKNVIPPRDIQTITIRKGKLKNGKRKE